MWKISTALPLQLAVIQVGGLRVDTEDQAFQALTECARTYQTQYEGVAVGKVEGVQYARRLFRAIGLDPTKRRPSSEALLRRALKGKDLYRVNSLVDAGNWCSLDFLLPIGIYDLDKVVGDVTVRTGHEEESYAALNHQTINFHNRYVLADEQGAFGSPMTDSQRTSIQTTTERAALVIYAPNEYETDALKDNADIFARRVTDLCGGKVTSLEILRVAS